MRRLDESLVARAGTPSLGTWFVGMIGPIVLLSFGITIGPFWIFALTASGATVVYFGTVVAIQGRRQQ
jgi:hypothetical protein